MTVSADVSTVTYAGDDASTSFDTGASLIFFENSELVVEVANNDTGGIQTLVLDVNYTVSGGSGSSGTVDLSGGSSPYGILASGTTLIIRRVLPITQEDDFVNGENSDAEILEDRLDKLTLIAQQLSEQVGRAFKASVAEGSIDDLPIPAVRRGKVLTFEDDPAAAPQATDLSTLEGDLILATDIPQIEATYSTLTALASGDLLNGQIFVVAGRSSALDGGEGVFQWRTGDQASNVTADPGQGVWVPPDDDTSGASGAWKRHGTDYKFEWFGAVRDGSTDDATAIQNAIDYVESVGGGVISAYDQGKYGVGSTLYVDESNVMLRGLGRVNLSGGMTDMNASPGTTFKWVGGATGPLIKFTSNKDDDGTRIRRSGGGLDKIHLDGNETATRGFILETWYGGYFEFSTGYFTNYHWLITTLPNGVSVAPDDTQHNTFIIHSAEINVSAGKDADTLGILNSGGAGGNTSMNDFRELYLLSEDTSIALELGDTDTNKFFFCRCGTRLTPVVLGGQVFLHADDTIGTVPAQAEARYNKFYALEAAEGITARATDAGTTSSFSNTIYGLSRGNGAPIPTVEAGATLFWLDSHGAAIQSHFSSHTESFLIADDSVAVFEFNRGSTGFSVFNFSLASRSIATGAGLFSVRTGTSPFVVDLASSIGGGNTITTTTGVLTGTTGTDTHLTISAHTDGKLYIENRCGANARFSIVFMAHHGDQMSADA